MRWRADLNESHNLPNGQVRMLEFAEGENLELTFDNKATWIKPNCEKEGVKGFDITFDRNGRKGIDFGIFERGYSEFPHEEIEQAIEESPQPTDWMLGQHKGQYGTSYFGFIDEVGGGESFFDFKGQNVSYPDFQTTEKRVTEDLVVVGFPTHSIVNYAGTDFVSSIEYWLIDEEGNTVIHVKDTKGGYHPCTFGVPCNAKLRGNNHPDDSNRWIKQGNYRLRVRNLSTNPRAIQRLHLISVRDDIVFLDVNIPPNSEPIDFEVRFDRLNDEFNSYKLNCNCFTEK
jgi:hypothetical protein